MIRFKRSHLFSALLVAIAISAHADTPASNRIAALEARLDRLESAPVRDGIPLQVYWQDGIRMQSPDRAIQLRLGGRVQQDFAGIDASSSLEDEDTRYSSGTRFRRARLYIGGSLYEHAIFNLEYEFNSGESLLRTTFIGLRNVPFLGTVRVGRLLEYYSFEQLSGNNFHTFGERGLPAAFNNYWANGVGIHNSFLDGRASWAIGAARRTDSNGTSSSENGENISLRLTAAPVYAQGGRQWVHLGAATIQRRPDAGQYRVFSRPESSVVPIMVDTEGIPADRVNLGGLEFAAAHGPLSIQAEWHNARVSLREEEEFPHDGSASLSGFYVYVSYFLTGEHRAYNPATGVLGRVRPHANIGAEGRGLGAWELAARYSELDLNDGPVEGGHLRNATVGLNWYLNPNMKVMGSYIRADLKDSGSADIVQARLHFDF